jgi:hypothetical protein
MTMGKLSAILGVSVFKHLQRISYELSIEGGFRVEGGNLQHCERLVASLVGCRLPLI